MKVICDHSNKIPRYQILYEETGRHCDGGYLWGITIYWRGMLGGASSEGRRRAPLSGDVTAPRA